MSETPLTQCTTLAGCLKCSVNGTPKWLTEIKLRFDSNVQARSAGALSGPGFQLEGQDIGLFAATDSQCTEDEHDDEDEDDSKFRNLGLICGICGFDFGI